LARYIAGKWFDVVEFLAKVGAIMKPNRLNRKRCIIRFLFFNGYPLFMDILITAIRTTVIELVLAMLKRNAD